jgi:hypothetical protein
LKTMLRKGLNIFISILLLLPLFTGEVGFSQAIGHASPSFQKACDMDDCNPNVPKCPLCSSSSSIILYLDRKTIVYLPASTSSYILLNVRTLSDQGYVKVIFHPPTNAS